MKIVALVNGKGGVGKTTSAINLAQILSEDHRTLLVDTDPQGSASWWAGQVGESGSEWGMGFDVAQENDPSILTSLREVEGYDMVVADTQPALGSRVLTTVLEGSDYVVLPTPPAPMDLTALIETVRTLISGSGVSHRVLLTRVDSRSLNEALAAQNALLDSQIPTFHSFVRSYKAHERAALEGIPITAYGGRQARSAEADYRRVADELMRDLENGSAD